LAVLQPHRTLTEYYATEHERRGFVRRLFDDTARDYDRLNGLFSFGTGRLYRRAALRRAGLAAGERVLDVAAGTGLLAAEARHLAGPAGLVIALDVSWGMLRAARDIPGLAAVQAEADHMPLRERQFDLLTMGYALRHVATLNTAFAEFHRVLRPGGRLLLLEIGRPRSRFGHALLRLYLGRIVPLLSRFLGRSGQAARLMRYYWDTIDHCVPPETILAAMRLTGFSDCRCDTALGVFHSYAATRPSEHGQHGDHSSPVP
jgi:demethylmenaquinone methyltransferase / 2-methoxy-6-polyprenyl-1,4-benzoquinol methylase